MLTNELDNPNYRAKIVKIDRLEPHPGADRLQIAVVDFQRIIVGLDTQIGNLFVYFPLESQINSEFMSFINGYSSADLNRDKTKKGFFSNRSRVKATRLRGIVSEGYLHPLDSFNSFLQEKGIKFQVTEKEVGTEFDSVGDLLICQKYVVKIKNQQSEGGGKKNKKAKKTSRLIEGQLRLHVDSNQFKKNLHRIDPDSIISVSNKVHGCNATLANVLCKKKLKLHEKLLKKLGVNIVDYEYSHLAASRRVVKNDSVEQNHYYKFDLWNDALARVKDKIKEGHSLYIELAGQLPTGGFIQNQYDYGCNPNDYKILVFRITYTDHKGNVFEFTKPQIEAYCKKYELETVPFYYYGKAKDMYPELDTQNHWHENFLAKLIEDYTEKDCDMCRNKVPKEGLIIVKEGDVYEPLKLKSLSFLKRETEELDKEQVNIEDE